MSLGQTPEPSVTTPVYYLHRTFSAPISEWEMLTGRSRSNTEPEVLAEIFRAVVRKKVISERNAFGDWHGLNIADPDQRQQLHAEEAVTSGTYGVQHGLISEAFDGSVPVMHVDYFVTVDPATLPEEVPDGISEELGQPSPVVPFFIGFALAGITTSLLVNKDAGLKLLAGVAGGITGGMILVQLANAAHNRSVSA